MLVVYMYFYFKNAVRAHMERTAQKSVQNTAQTKDLVTTSMELVPTGVKMDTQEISVISVRRFVKMYFSSSYTLFNITDTSIYMITLACEHGRYGKNCSNICSSKCKTCNHTDGTCSCHAGWSGPNCSFGICFICLGYDRMQIIKIYIIS